MTTDHLDVWLYGTHISAIERAADGRLSLTWTAAGRARWGEGARILSAKLPVGSTPVAALVTNYLDGLLPEGNARTNHAIAAGVPPDNTFGLIRAYGRDTPGAAIFVESGSGDPTRSGRYEPITLEEVAMRLRNADEHSPARFDGLAGESSTLPGMVPKITLHRDGVAWYACKDGAASTWIIKRAFPDDSGIRDIVDTEVASLALARDLGISSIEAELLELEDASGRHRAIAVSRYDRIPASDPRLHQEDLAQAIGLNTSDPNRKFQYGSRMPSLAHAADVLRLDGGNRDDLLRLATFSYLMGNTDMHAKNISFLRLSDGRVQLAPAYDVAMHLHHPRDNRRFALDVNGKYRVDDITMRDLIAEGVSWGLPSTRSERVVIQTATDLDVAIALVDRALFPGVPEAAWERVAERVHKATNPITQAIDSRHSPRGLRMPSSAQVRRKLAELATERADLEKKISAAQARRSKRESDAAAREVAAVKASSDSMRRTFERQAQSARKEVLRENKKIADLSKRLAAVARDEGAHQKELVAAEKSEATTARRDADQARRDRERQERKAVEAHRAEQRRLQQERLADERLSKAAQDETASLIAATEQRLTEKIAEIRPPKKEELRILYATSSPDGDLRLDEEIRRVKAAVKRSTHRDQVRVEHLPAATPGDLLDNLVAFRPHVLHFSGHGDETALVFDDGADEHGPGVALSATIFKKVVESTDEAPLLVVLNACESASQLNALLGKVPIAIGMSDSVGDVDSLTFATRFYSSLAEGQSVSAALATARVDMEMNGLQDQELPVLESVAGIDPSAVHLVAPPA